MRSPWKNWEFVKFGNEYQPNKKGILEDILNCEDKQVKIHIKWYKNVTSISIRCKMESIGHHYCISACDSFQVCIMSPKIEISLESKRSSMTFQGLSTLLWSNLCAVITWLNLLHLIYSLTYTSNQIVVKSNVTVKLSNL